MRAANRQTVELALDGAVQFGIVHILAHGATSVLDFGGERMSEAELVSLMSSQKALQFVFLACCNGYEAAGGIHNALHVPVVAYNAPIDDRAAVEFARGFYRSWRRDRDVSQAVDRGREALAVLYPSEAPKVRLINGDMVTPSAFGACMGKIDERLDRMGAQLVGIEERLDRMDEYPRRWLYVGLLLGVLLIVAQVGTPFLNAALFGQVTGCRGSGDRGQPASSVARGIFGELAKRFWRPVSSSRRLDGLPFPNRSVHRRVRGRPIPSVTMSTAKASATPTAFAAKSTGSYTFVITPKPFEASKSSTTASARPAVSSFPNLGGRGSSATM